MKENSKCNVIVFSNRAIDEIQKETYRKSPAETGGILLGKIIGDKWYVIATTEPGPNSIFQISYFEYDQDFVTKEANRISKEFEHELELLGLWHRHPGSMDYFSSTDDGTNELFAKLREEGAISGLVNLDPDFRITMYHVDFPLKYEKMEVFVGDDLIPPDLLKLKPNIKQESEPVLISNNEPYRTINFNNESKNSKIKEKPNPKNTSKVKFRFINLFFLLLGLINLLLLFYVLNQIGDGKRINEKAEYTSADKKIDALKISFSNEYDQKQKAINENKFKSTLDSAYQKDKDLYVKENLEDAIKKGSDSATASTKLAKEYDSINKDYDSLRKAKIELFHNVERHKYIENKLKENKPVETSWSESFFNKIRLKTPLLLLINLLISAFLSIYRVNLSKQKTMIVIALSLLFGVITLITLPNLSVFGISYVFKISMSSLIIWLSAILIIFLLTKIHFNKNSFWYQKRNSLLETEKSLIQSNFPEFKLDTNEEDGRLFWHGKLMSAKGNPYTIQVVYDNDYNGEPNQIHTYFIDPDLSELQVEKDNLPFTVLDNSNIYHLQFDKKGIKNSALLTIRFVEKWINNFESWLDNKITLDDFKNLKID